MHWWETETALGQSTFDDVEELWMYENVLEGSDVYLTHIRGSIILQVKHDTNVLWNIKILDFCGRISWIYSAGILMWDAFVSNIYNIWLGPYFSKHLAQVQSKWNTDAAFEWHD